MRAASRCRIISAMKAITASIFIARLNVPKLAYWNAGMGISSRSGSAYGRKWLASMRLIGKSSGLRRQALGCCECECEGVGEVDAATKQLFYRALTVTICIVAGLIVGAQVLAIFFFGDGEGLKIVNALQPEGFSLIGAMCVALGLVKLAETHETV